MGHEKITKPNETTRSRGEDAGEGGGGGTPGNSWWGCARFSKILTLFQTKNVTFHTRFQTWPLRNYVIIT